MKEMIRKIWKAFVIFILALAACLFFYFSIFLRDALGGGVHIHFETPDNQTKIFAREFAREFIIGAIEQKIVIKQFSKMYSIHGYIEDILDEATGKSRSAIRILIDNDQKVAVEIWRDDLISTDLIRAKAKEAAGRILTKLIEQEKVLAEIIT